MALPAKIMSIQGSFERASSEHFRKVLRMPNA
jgi:hypothetical protein